MLLSTAGVLVLTLGNTTQATLAPGWWMAVPYAAGTAVSWAVGWLLSAYALRRGVGCFHALATTSGTALLCLNVYVLLSGQISSCVTIPSAQKGSKNLLGSRSMGWKCILGVFFLVYMIGFIAINLQLFM
jgi:hypothetical protein